MAVSLSYCLPPHLPIAAQATFPERTSFRHKRPVHMHRPFHYQACLWHPAASGKNFSGHSMTSTFPLPSTSVERAVRRRAPKARCRPPWRAAMRGRGCRRPGAAQAPAPCRIAALDQPVVSGSSHPGSPKGTQPCLAQAGAPTPAPAPDRPGPPRR